MDYIDWCGVVLKSMYDAGVDSPAKRNHGIEESVLGKQILGDRFAAIRSKDHDFLFHAAFDLFKIGLIENIDAMFWKLTPEGRRAAKNIIPVWEAICVLELDSSLEQLLAIVNKNSAKRGDDFAFVMDVPMTAIMGEFTDGVTREDIEELLVELKSHNLVYWDNDGPYPSEARTTYAGLVWTDRRSLVLESKSSDDFAAEREMRLQLQGENNQLSRVIDQLIQRPTYSVNTQGGPMGDKYEISGQAGAIGPHAQASDMTFNQIVNNVEQSIDLATLATQLSEMRQAIMAKQDASPQALKAIGRIIEAEEAATEKNTPMVVEHLKAAGQWTLDFAKEIGKDVVVAAIKLSMGMG